MSQDGSGSYADGPVVAVDGPSGSGKSSAAKGVARALGLRYLDTGAMYRALTWWMLRAEVDLTDPTAIAERMGATETEGPALSIGTDANIEEVGVDGVEVAGPIRDREVSNAVSAVSAVPLVRERMVAHQRRLIGAGSIVVEGRDIGSTVAPDATLKVYLTASAEERARRRNAEPASGTPVQGPGEAGHARGSAAGSAVAAAEVERTRAEMAWRDRLDSTRVASPLTRADGAIELDTTGLNLDQVVEAISVLVAEATTGSTTGPATGPLAR